MGRLVQDILRKPAKLYYESQLTTREAARSMAWVGSTSLSPTPYTRDSPTNTRTTLVRPRETWEQNGFGRVAAVAFKDQLRALVGDLHTLGERTGWTLAGARDVLSNALA